MCAGPEVENGLARCMDPLAIDGQMRIQNSLHIHLDVAWKNNAQFPRIVFKPFYIQGSDQTVYRTDLRMKNICSIGFFMDKTNTFALLDSETLHQYETVIESERVIFSTYILHWSSFDIFSEKKQLIFNGIGMDV